MLKASWDVFCRIYFQIGEISIQKRDKKISQAYCLLGLCIVKTWDYFWLLQQILLIPKKQLYNTNYFLALGILHNKVHIWVWGRVVGSRSPHTQVGRYRLGRCVGFTTSWHLRVYWRRKHIAVTTKGMSFSNKISAWAERCSVVLYWGQQTWSRPIQSGRAPELCRVLSPTLKSPLTIVLFWRTWGFNEI